MSELQIFKNAEFGSVRTVTVEGEPYFVAKDVTEILGYANASKAIADHVDVEDKLNNESLSSLGQRGGWLINESGLYSLILSSKLPDAKKFKRWITSEVLPSIRKTGSYSIKNLDSYMIEDPIARAERWVEEYKEKQRLQITVAEQEEQIKKQEEHIAELKPKVTYCEEILQCKNAIPITLIAKDYGMSAQKMNNILSELNIQYKCAGTWVLKQDYADCGYTKSMTYTYNTKYGKSANITTCWTQEGRMFLYRKLKDAGVLPLIERVQN